MALSKIDTPALVADAVGNTILDLSENYAFSGTVTGAGGGKVLNTEFNSNATPVVSSDTTAWKVSVSKTITPSATSSKIIINAMLSVDLYASQRVDMEAKLRRAITGGATTDFAPARYSTLHGTGTLYPYLYGTFPLTWEDSPSTTSEITYSIIFRRASTSGTIYSSRGNAPGASSICLTEVGV